MPSFAKGSTTEVTMWTSRKTTTSSDRLRCNDCTTNLGHAAVLWRIEVSRPTTTVALSSRSAVYPLARVAYQSGVGPSAAAINALTGSGAAGHRGRGSAVGRLGELPGAAQAGLDGTGSGDAGVVSRRRSRWC